MPIFGELKAADITAVLKTATTGAELERATRRMEQLETALVALIDAVDAKDRAAIERALFVGRGLTF